MHKTNFWNQLKSKNDRSIRSLSLQYSLQKATEQHKIQKQNSQVLLTVELGFVVT